MSLRNFTVVLTGRIIAGDFKLNETEQCYCWKMSLKMSMNRHLELNEEMRRTLTDYDYWNLLPDGDVNAFFIGEQKDCRTLARELAKRWKVKTWRFVPWPSKSFVYTGGKAYRDDLINLDRKPKEESVSENTQNL